MPKKIRGRDITDYGAIDGLFFFVNDGNELWKTAGTVKSARMIEKFDWPVDIRVGHASRHDFMVFTVEDPKLGAEPWVTDGTPKGTVLLKNVEPGSGSSFPGQFFDGTNFTLFFASTTRFGREPWVTRGGPASTQLLMDIIPGEADSEIYGYARLKDKVVFSAWAKEGHSYRERLFITDGTPKGTRKLSSRAQPTGSLLSLGDRVLYQDYRGNQTGTDEIWMTRGEPDDEVQVSHFGDVNPNFSITNMAAAEVLRDAKRATPCPD